MIRFIRSLLFLIVLAFAYPTQAESVNGVEVVDKSTQAEVARYPRHNPAGGSKPEPYKATINTLIEGKHVCFTKNEFDGANQGLFLKAQAESQGLTQKGNEQIHKGSVFVEKAHSAATISNATFAARCEKWADHAIKACDEAIVTYNKEIRGGVEAHNQALATAAEQNAKNLQEACDGSIALLKLRADAYAAQAGTSVEAAVEASAVAEASKGGAGAQGKKSWWDKNKGYVIGAGAAVGGCYMIGLCGSDDSETVSAGSPAPTTGGAGKDPGTGEETPQEDGYTATTCLGDDDYKKTACQDYFLETCQKNPGTNACDLFANQYCDLGNGTDDGGGLVSGGGGAGAGSDYCMNVIKTRYCATAGHTECPTCVTMKNNEVSHCEKNPGYCTPQYTAHELKLAQNSCPTDPAYGDPAIQAKLKEVDLGDGTGGGGIQARSIPSGGSSDYKTGSGVTTYSVIGGSRGVAQADKGVKFPDIGKRHGPTLWNKTSSAIQRYCQNGGLENCSRR